MRKYSIFFIILFLLRYSTQAQVTLSPQVPPVGVMLKSQLWNMALLNGGAGSMYVTISLTLLSTHDNQPILQASTQPILLNKGVNMLNEKSIGPVQYVYGLAAGAIDRDANGFLAVGNYRACYKVSAGENFGTPIAEDCLPVEVQPLSPPQLNLPADTATVQTPYPQFTWLPPLPINLFSNLNYDLLVVEVLPGQSPYEAIQKNMPVYNISDYKSLVHQYPSSYKALDTGRVYAWRVIAKNEGQFIAQSEVWSFRLATVRQPVTIAVNGNYIPLRKINEPGAGTYTLPDIGAIGIKYYSYEKNYSATIQFMSDDGSIVETHVQPINYGDNFLTYPLSKAFTKEKVYIITLTDAQANKYRARFSIHK